MPSAPNLRSTSNPSANRRSYETGAWDHIDPLHHSTDPPVNSVLDLWIFPAIKNHLRHQALPNRPLSISIFRNKHLFFLIMDLQVLALQLRGYQNRQQRRPHARQTAARRQDTFSDVPAVDIIWLCLKTRPKITCSPFSVQHRRIVGRKNYATDSCSREAGRPSRSLLWGLGV
jgi:hypothetical protein